MYFQRRCCLKFSLPYGPMVTKKPKKKKKKKKKCKKIKFEKTTTKGKCLEIWWTDSVSQNLALIRLTVSEKTSDDGRPRDDSSSAMQ